MCPFNYVVFNATTFITFNKATSEVSIFDRAIPAIPAING